MLGIVGGSGLNQMAADFEVEQSLPPDTPYGEASSELLLGRLAGNRVAFLPRHGRGHRLPPHRINYRANVWSLNQAGVDRLVSVNAVGGISPQIPPLGLALPRQLIDYTSERASTFFDGDDAEVRHIDFTYPFSESLCHAILQSAGEIGLAIHDGGTYGCTNGPRLETAAEVQRLKRDGCDMVGMTAMPEAALARELEIDYASLSLSVNWAAGIEDDVISIDEIMLRLKTGMSDVMRLLKRFAEDSVE